MKKDELYNKLIEQAATVLSALQEMYAVHHIVPIIDEILIEQMQMQQENHYKNAIEWGIELQQKMGETTKEILRIWSTYDDSLVGSGKHHQLHLRSLQE